MGNRPPVTVVCVFNDLEVRRDCLDRSIDLHRAEMPGLEYIPVDNTGGRFSSAGAALNHGASEATNDVVVFVHQDVYLHSLTALGEAAAAVLGGGDIGLLGAVGVRADGRVIGRMRDRVVVIGDPARSPVDVDSLDEVLFMARTAQLRDAPLAESSDLAWHAYAIEYGLRMRGLGKRVVAMDVPLTHNSMTTNLARLTEAHAEIARRYPSELPVRTTCGVVRENGSAVRGPRILRGQRWRYRWLRNSVRARAVRAALGGAPVVLNDIRLDVDSILADLEGALTVASVDHGRAPGDPLTEEVRLTRGLHEVDIRLVDRPGAAGLLDRADAVAPVLLTDLSVADLEALREHLTKHPLLVGLHEALGCWALAGVATDGRLWQRPGTVPLLARRPTAA